MKKTLVAIAALAAVSGAMAEVTISGQIDAAVNSTKTTTTGGVSSTTNSIAESGAGQSQITFAASEDLSDGMKAFGALRINPRAWSAGGVAASNLSQDVSEIGLSGAFGKVLLNRDYGIGFAVHATADASGWTSGAKGVVHNQDASISNGVVYVLPTFVPGLDVTLAKGLAGNAGGSGDATAYKLSYTTGGLLLQYAAYTASTTSSSTWATNFTIGGTTATSDTLAAGYKAKGTAIAGTYDLGMAKLHAGMFSAQSTYDGDQKSSSYMYGVSAPFGATTLGLTVSGADRTSALAATKKATGYRVKAAYAFSKRTTGYAAYGSEGASSTTATAKETAVGVTHAF